MLKSRTIWLNLIALIAALLNFALGHHLWGPEADAFIIPVLAILNGMLRLDTVAPVGVKLERVEIEALKAGAAHLTVEPNL